MLTCRLNIAFTKSQEGTMPTVVININGAAGVQRVVLCHVRSLRTPVQVVRAIVAVRRLGPMIVHFVFGRLCSSTALFSGGSPDERLRGRRSVTQQDGLRWTA